MNPQTTFLHRFESELRQLKESYCESVTPDWQAAQRNFRDWVKQHLPEDIGAAELSSLFTVPTRELFVQKRCYIAYGWAARRRRPR